MYKLLIADDEPVIRRGLTSIDWESIQVSVIGEADNGIDAIEMLQSEFVDIILTDIKMPGLDGIGVAKFAAEQELYTEVILLSGYSDFEYARKAIQYGVSEYIVKPSSPQELLEVVQRACRRVEKRRARDMRFKLLEKELSKKQLTLIDDLIVVGDPEYSAAAQKVLTYLSANYAKPISLSSASEYLHFSTTYLSKVIKKETGYNFLDLLNALRIHDAASKLRDSNMSFQRICESVSIADPRYFSQVFKKYLGVTPSAYRKRPVLFLDVKLGYIVNALRGDKL